MRIGFVDEMGQRGQVDLRAVQPGDRVKFLDTFEQRVGPKGKLHIAQGALGEVQGVGQEVVEVLAPTHRTQGAEMHAEEAVVAVRAEQVELVINSQDPRVGKHRIGAVRFRAADGPRIQQALWALGPDFLRAHGRAPEPSKMADVIWCARAMGQRLREKAEDERPSPELVEQGEEYVLREAPSDVQALAEAEAYESLAENLSRATPADWRALLEAHAYQPEDFAAPAPAPAPTPAPAPGPAPEERPASTSAPASTAPATEGPPVPIRMPPGAGNTRAYSDPGLRVYSLSRKRPGTVIGNRTPDLLVVELADGDTESWDAMDVRVDVRNTQRPRLVDPDEFNAWISARRRRLRAVLLHMAHAHTDWMQGGLQ